MPPRILPSILPFIPICGHYFMTVELMTLSTAALNKNVFQYWNTLLCIPYLILLPHLPSVGTIEADHHTQLTQGWGWHWGFHTCQASILPSGFCLQPHNLFYSQKSWCDLPDASASVLSVQVLSQDWAKSVGWGHSTFNVQVEHDLLPCLHTWVLADLQTLLVLGSYMGHSLKPLRMRTLPPLE